MLDQQIEVVFENGVFRPLQSVDLPEHQRVTLLLPAAGGVAKNGTLAGEDELDEEVGYEPLSLQQRKTIRVRLKRVGDFSPVPYPVELDDLEQE